MTVAAQDVTRWFHSFRFPDGEQVAGIKTIETLEREETEIFRGDMSGRSLLDIGAWDGYFSYAAERRGAAEVLATDHFCWSGPGWGNKAGFDAAHARFGSKVRAIDVDPLDLDPEIHGRYDDVLLLGVLYHVTDPYRVLEKAAAMCSDHLVVETVTALRSLDIPAMRLYTELELNDDPTNFWALNIAAIRHLLTRFGFTRIEVLPADLENVTWRRRIGMLLGREQNRRAIVHAWR
ncbi:class I SAM-dependent methyltransferase [Sphingomonas crocodyli]|uniref:Methyltransferase domain-containing protein n=1 Tax=Sphingomonas crocodyli TaxID=1979270 RepID=A0A437LZJ9_9SPHN|nr:methyltransferase domain-containing protein [Sphingomonas crocodyli]RVT90776.1 methyltransferase domain-containing protein [Sphingomonas crocodyli]